MSARTRVRPPEVRDLAEEQEVDVRRYWDAVRARWWLPVLGLLAGIAAGYVLSLGGGTVYRAEATLYLGQPFSPGGGAPVQGLATLPTTVSQFARSAFAQNQAARKAGIPARELRGKVSTQTVAATGRTAVRPGQSQLVELQVTGTRPKRTADAANALARMIVDRVSAYPNAKIQSLEVRIRAQEAQVTSLNNRIGALTRTIPAATDPFDRLVLVQQVGNLEDRLAALQERRADALEELALAEEVERAAIFQPAVAEKTTARSRRNSMLVGGILGLLLGGLAAALWEPALARRRSL